MHVSVEVTASALCPCRSNLTWFLVAPIPRGAGLYVITTLEELSVWVVCNSDYAARRCLEFWLIVSRDTVMKI